MTLFTDLVTYMTNTNLASSMEHLFCGALNNSVILIMTSRSELPEMWSWVWYSTNIYAGPAGKKQIQRPQTCDDVLLLFGQMSPLFSAKGSTSQFPLALLKQTSWTNDDKIECYDFILKTWLGLHVAIDTILYGKWSEPRQPRTRLWTVPKEGYTLWWPVNMWQGPCSW